MPKLHNRKKRNKKRKELLNDIKKILSATVLLGDIEDDKLAIKLMTQFLKKIGRTKTVQVNQLKEKCPKVIRQERMFIQSLKHG